MRYFIANKPVARVILTNYNKLVINNVMNVQQFKSARRKKGWTQTQAAVHLHMTQAYLNLLEHGKRRLTPELVRRATLVYGLSPEVLPVAETFTPTRTDNQHLAEWLARLEYPGFSYLSRRAPRKNPAEVLLTALAQENLEGRVAEALPWVVLNYAKADEWLVGNARRYNLQNRLGFVVSLAHRVAEKTASQKVAELSELERMLEESKLAKEDSFYRPPRTESEKEWLRRNRTNDASFWNLLTDMKPENLQYAHAS